MLLFYAGLALLSLTLPLDPEPMNSQLIMLLPFFVAEPLCLVPGEEGLLPAVPGL